MHGNKYKAYYKKYNSIIDSTIDYLEWCKRHNLTGIYDIEELCEKFANSGYAEGIGRTKQEAKLALKNQYIDTTNSVKNRLKKLNLI
jgi:hypothetical protein